MTVNRARPWSNRKLRSSIGLLSSEEGHGGPALTGACHRPNGTSPVRPNPPLPKNFPLSLTGDNKPLVSSHPTLLTSHTFSNMPPRIPNTPSSLLLQSSACSGSSSRCTASRLPTWASSCPSNSPQSSLPTTHQQQCSSFSTTAPAQGQSVRRQKMFTWLARKGAQFKEHTRQGPNLLGGQSKDGLAIPFPQNPHFKSQPILSEGSREIIYKDVMEKGLPIKAVSAKYNVDVRRVAAVIRLKEIEKRWIKEVSSPSPFVCRRYRAPPRSVLVSPAIRTAGGDLASYDELQENSISLEDIPHGYKAFFN